MQVHSCTCTFIAKDSILEQPLHTIHVCGQLPAWLTLGSLSIASCFILHLMNNVSVTHSKMGKPYADNVLNSNFGVYSCILKAFDCNHNNMTSWSSAMLLYFLYKRNLVTKLLDMMFKTEQAVVSCIQAMAVLHGLHCTITPLNKPIACFPSCCPLYLALLPLSLCCALKIISGWSISGEQPLMYVHICRLW